MDEYEARERVALAVPSYAVAGLDILLADLRQYADLTAFGRRVAGLEIARGLNTWKVGGVGTPTVTSTGPIAVAGLPRTGSTFLHQLIAHRRGWSGIPNWYLHAPPYESLSDESVTRHRLAADARLSLLSAASPSVEALHPMRSHWPDECNLFMQDTFCSPQYSVMFFVPTYTERWQSQFVAHQSIEWYRDRLATYNASFPSRLVLKSPFHLFWYRDLVRTLGVKTIIQIYRDSAKVIASWCALVCAIRSAFARVDPIAVGAEWTRLWRLGLENGLSDRLELDSSTVSFIGLRYESLIDQPTRTVELLLERMGDPLARPRSSVAPEPEIASFGLSECVYHASEFGVQPDSLSALRELYRELCQPIDVA
jgi:hypothetical protein